MKAEARVMDVTSTITGEKVGMSIDKNALAHIMSVLTDLYSDPELAIIREYSTNAYDAHVEAGIVEPIRVTLPSPLAPFFRVRDFGYGLNAEDIREIYSRYGASSKRESNDMVGMLGLGCKSALTYTDQFTLTGIKDGICTQVSISRDADGGGSMTIVDQYSTDEPSGVEIVVPVRAHNSLENKAASFFSFWEKGTVLVNGVEPDRVDGIWVTPNLLYTTGAYGRDYVVMGNVAYPFDSKSVSYDNTWSVVAFVNIGDVHFTPSRETLQMTDKTKATLENINTELEEHRHDALVKFIDEATSKHEAIERMFQVSGLNNSRRHNAEQMTYKGEPIPAFFKFVTEDHPFVNVRWDKYYRERGWYAEPHISVNQASKTVWLTGFDENMTPHKRKKIIQWATNKGISAKYFVLIDVLPTNSDWLDPTTIYTWSEAEAEKIARPVNNKWGAPASSYHVCVNGTWEWQNADEIDTLHPIFWITPHEGTPTKYLNHFAPDGWSVASLATNRVNKFKRLFPQACKLSDYQQATADKWIANLSPRDKAALASRNNHDIKNILLWVDATKIDDPDLRFVLESAKMALPPEYQFFNQQIETDIESPLSGYPLLSMMSLYNPNHAQKKHIYIYLNAAYAAKRKDHDAV